MPQLPPHVTTTQTTLCSWRWWLTSVTQHLARAHFVPALLGGISGVLQQ